MIFRKTLGIDLGNTIVGSRERNDRYYVEPRCFEIINKLEKIYDIYIISKVNSEQRERSLKWLQESNFFIKTGVNPNNLFYCFERKDKAIFSKALNIDIFIDDRCQVMQYLDDRILKLLINPETTDLEKYKDKLINTQLVKSWEEIEKILL